MYTLYGVYTGFTPNTSAQSWAPKKQYYNIATVQSATIHIGLGLQQQTANITKQALERIHINVPIQTKTKSYSPLTHAGPLTRNRIPLSRGQVLFTNRKKPEFRIHRPNNNLAQSTYRPPLCLRSRTQDSRSLSHSAGQPLLVVDSTRFQTQEHGSKLR